MTVAFIPSLGQLVARFAGRTLPEVWAEPGELARNAIEAHSYSGATHVLLPFDTLVLAEAAGGLVEWELNNPVLRSIESVELDQIEPDEVLERGRVPAAVKATYFVAQLAPVASLLPLPETVVTQLGGDTASSDHIAAAQDLCSAMARRLLEAGSSVLLLTSEGAETDASNSQSLHRVAEHFKVHAHEVENDPAVATLPVSTLVREPPTLTECDFPSATRIVITDRAVPATIDLARLARTATAIKSLGSD